MKRQLFVTFEGIDGAGKSTQIELLNKRLVSDGHDVVVTREPGGTPLAEQLRHIVLHTNNHLCSDAETLIMFAARAQHLNQLIVPALQEDKIVICSRFSDATLAYQGFGRGLERSRLETLINWTHRDIHPDITLILDLDPIIALARREQRDDVSDRFERERLDFMQRVREGYLQLAQDHPKRYIVIDATQHINHIASEILQRIYLLLQHDTERK